MCFEQVQALQHLSECTAGTARLETERKYIISTLQEISSQKASVLQSADAQAALVNMLTASKGLPDLACALLPIALSKSETWPPALFERFADDALGKQAWVGSRAGEGLAQAVKATMLRSAGLAPRHDGAQPTAQASAAVTPAGARFEHAEQLLSAFFQKLQAFLSKGLEGSMPLDKVKGILHFACRCAPLSVVQRGMNCTLLALVADRWHRVCPATSFTAGYLATTRCHGMHASSHVPFSTSQCVGMCRAGGLRGAPWLRSV